MPGVRKKRVPLANLLAPPRGAFAPFLLLPHKFPDQCRGVWMRYACCAIETHTTSQAHRGIQRSLALPVFHIELGSMLGEELNHFIQSPKCGAVQRRLFAIIDGVDIHAGLQTKLDGFNRVRLGFPAAGVLYARAEECLPVLGCQELNHEVTKSTKRPFSILSPDGVLW